MNELLKKIFIELGYKEESLVFTHGEINCPVNLYTKETRSYFVLDISKAKASILINFLETVQGELFEWAVSEFKEFSSEKSKNSYLLLTVEDILKKENEAKVFINIEEDAYFFKKYVLSYSEDEVVSLENSFGENNVISSLGELAGDQSVFERYSENKDLVGFERLLYQLFVKIPSLTLPKNSKEFEDLSSVLENAILDAGLSDTHMTILSRIGKTDEKDISLSHFKEIVDKI